MNGWALSGLAVFGGFTLLGLGDVVGVLPGFAGIGLAAGFSPGAPALYSFIPPLFSLVIGLCAGLTLLRVLQRKRQKTAGSARLVAYAFIAYGIYELALLVLLLGQNPFQTTSLGIAFVLMGFGVNWLGWRVARAL
jgi:hypothetical protein